MDLLFTSNIKYFRDENILIDHYIVYFISAALSLNILLIKTIYDINITL